MSEKLIAEGRVKYLQILDEKGNCDEALRPPLTPEEMRRFYQMMVQIRVFDEVAFSLQREGRALTYAPLLGQEAVQIGTALALNPEDWVVGTYRDNGVYIARGLPMEMAYLYWSGDERGGRMPDGLNIVPYAIPVGTQAPHAVGLAWGFKLRGEPRVVACYFGDGATSTGDVHEGLTFAGVLKAPTVFICSNNQYAISVPRREQCAAETLAQKAWGYGFEGIQIDGNDIFAVYRATREAAAKARGGGGPTFIECVTYRRWSHTTADDPTRYRSAEEVSSWEQRDPVDRLQKYLHRRGLWNEAWEKEVWAAARDAVSKAVAQSQAHPAPAPEDMFDHLYAELPPILQLQKEEMLQAPVKGD